jgi:two-component system chemotaxis sensor kinase CheA
VVQDAARRAGGSVRVESEPGAGTRFVLDLPLTAAIQPVLLVEAAGHPYALPAGRVEAVIRPEQLAVGQVPSRRWNPCCACRPRAAAPS